MEQLDYSLYLVAGPSDARGRSLSAAVREAVQGGVSMVQLRDKHSSGRDLFHLALVLKEILSPCRVPLIINDRLDIALAAEADGLHLGQEDLPLAQARLLMGSGAIIGQSVSTPEEARQAIRAGADYLGVGPVFPTATKEIEKPIGLAALESCCAAADIPCVAIGGIGPENLARVRLAGARGIAVVSALMSQPDIEQAAWRMKMLWNSR